MRCAPATLAAGVVWSPGASEPLRPLPSEPSAAPCRPARPGALKWQLGPDLAGVKDFQSVSLVQILRRLMEGEMRTEWLDRIEIPSCLSTQKPLLRPVSAGYAYHFYTSPHNEPAATLVAEVAAYLDAYRKEHTGLRRHRTECLKHTATSRHLDTRATSGQLNRQRTEQRWLGLSAQATSSRSESEGKQLSRGLSQLLGRQQTNVGSLRNLNKSHTWTNTHLRTIDKPEEMLFAERFLLYLDARTWGLDGIAHDDVELSQSGQRRLERGSAAGGTAHSSGGGVSAETSAAVTPQALRAAGPATWPATSNRRTSSSARSSTCAARGKSRQQLLETEVMAALRAGMQVWLVHEFAGEFGVEEFDHFFVHTPARLISNGLYANQLAVPFHECEHRKVRRAFGARRGAEGRGGARRGAEGRRRRQQCAAMACGRRAVRFGVATLMFTVDMLKSISPAPNLCLRQST